MTHIAIETYEKEVVCRLLEDGEAIADLTARREPDREQWRADSSSHPDSVAFQDFTASDEFIATAIVLNMMRRLRMTF